MAATFNYFHYGWTYCLHYSFVNSSFSLWNYRNHYGGRRNKPSQFPRKLGDFLKLLVFSDHQPKDILLTKICNGEQQEMIPRAASIQELCLINDLSLYRWIRTVVKDLSVNQLMDQLTVAALNIMTEQGCDACKMHNVSVYASSSYSLGNMGKSKVMHE